MRSFFKYFLVMYSAFLLLSGYQKTITSKAGIIKLTFRDTVEASPMVLDASTYTNPLPYAPRQEFWLKK